MRLSLFALASTLALASIPLFGDPIPYANVGQLAPDQLFTATGNGVVTAYFYSSGAGNDDKIILWDKTSGTRTAPALNNHSSAVGSSVSLSVKAGDSLVFVLDDVTTGQYFSSVDYFGVASPADYNDDGYNHAYSTPTPADSAVFLQASMSGWKISELQASSRSPAPTSTTTTTTSSSPMPPRPRPRPRSQAPSSSSAPAWSEQPAHSAASSPAAKSFLHQRSATPENVNLPSRVLL
ncbi:PEP-CTERM sorting domain-containing protein [Tunturiibacter empetritectus]|uniref:PEP-CTERM sorting domain-containing protein n=1 Tax=Tunturiibacter empetritectus TaxID=3069691 RepID=UPI003D9B9076